MKQNLTQNRISNLKKNMYMRTGIRGMLAAIIVLGLTFMSQSVKACDFTFKIEGETKTEYTQGDVVIVLVTLHLTHRVCPESIDETKFDFSGLKVLGATKWTEAPNGLYERKFKLEVIAGEKQIGRASCRERV